MSVQTAQPTSIRIFLADGTPDGIRIVGKSNWTGNAVLAGRAQLAEALKRSEMNRPGVYVLIGPGDSGIPRIYIGVADVLRKRLPAHQSKDFWTRFIAFTSTDQNLNTAHFRSLESKLIARAKEVNQWEVENSVSPAEPLRSEADRADAELFLHEMLMIYPVLGVDAFESASEEASSTDAGEVLFLSQQSAEAKGKEIKEGFIVMSDSLARGQELPGLGNLSMLREQLINTGVLVLDDKHLRFTQDYRFTSASQAASVLVGTASDGRMAWSNSEGKTLKQIQTESAEAAT